ncbi:uncharacterized protein LOC144910415 isoform X3 [Branchiostoma floridae x Branchiostoma belcheri]
MAGKSVVPVSWWSGHVDPAGDMGGQEEGLRKSVSDVTGQDTGHATVLTHGTFATVVAIAEGHAGQDPDHHPGGQSHLHVGDRGHTPAQGPGPALILRITVGGAQTPTCDPGAGQDHGHILVAGESTAPSLLTGVVAAAEVDQPAAVSAEVGAGHEGHCKVKLRSTQVKAAMTFNTDVCPSTVLFPPSTFTPASHSSVSPLGSFILCHVVMVWCTIRLKDTCFYM